MSVICVTATPISGIRRCASCLLIGMLLGGCALSEPTSEQLMMRTAPVNPEERNTAVRPSFRDIVDNIDLLNTHYIVSERYERQVVQDVFGANAEADGKPTSLNPLGQWSGGLGLSADIDDRFALGIGGILGDVNATVRVAGPYFFTASHTPVYTKNFEFIAQRRLLHPSPQNGWGLSLGAYWQRLRQQLGAYLDDPDAESVRQHTVGGRLFVRTPALDDTTKSTLHITLISRVGMETEFNTLVVAVGARFTIHVP